MKISTFRKTLLKNRLIKKQTYYEKIGDHNSTGLLLHLPRFYFVYKPKHMILTEQVVEILKTLPNCVSEYATMRDHFPIDVHNSLRKLYKMGSFQQFVHTDLVGSKKFLILRKEKRKYNLKNFYFRKFHTVRFTRTPRSQSGASRRLLMRSPFEYSSYVIQIKRFLICGRVTFPTMMKILRQDF